MKIRAIGNWPLFFCSLCFVWSSGSGQLLAGQHSQRQVTVFGNSSAAPTATRGIDPAEEADIRQLMHLVGTRDTIMQMLNTTMKSMRPLMLHALPPGPYRERLVNLFIQKFRSKATPQQVINLAVPIYAQYLSDADIKRLIQFYKTPLGQKWISVRPKLMAEVLPAAHSLGGEIGRQAMLEVLKEHPDLAREFKAAQQAAHSR